MRQVLLASAIVIVTSCADSSGQIDNGGGCNLAESGGGGGFGDDEGGGGSPCDANCVTPIDLRMTATAPTNGAYPNGTYPTIAEIAIGGTTDIGLAVSNDELSYEPLTLAYDAISDDPSKLQVVGMAGPIVTVRGLLGEDEATTIEIDDLDGHMLGSQAYFAAPIALVHAAPIAEIITTPESHGNYAEHVVYLAGSPELSIALVDDAATPHRLVDTSLRVTGAVQTGWDTVMLSAPTAGHYAVVVATGDGEVTSLDIEVVDGPDQMTVLENDATQICFAALASDAFVANLTWTYTLNGDPYVPDSLEGPNCVSNNLPDDAQLTATAGSVSLTVPVAI
jgi:hypothetical protein